MAYRIRQWVERYEVSDRNRALKPGEKMRQSALEYLRFPVHGRNWSASYRRFLKEAKDDAPSVYGVYVKLKEIAAQAEAGKRGVIRDDSGKALEAADIAECMGFPAKAVVRALAVLCRESVGWVECFRESPEIPGIPPSESYTETEADQSPPGIPAAATGLQERRLWAVAEWNKVASDRGWSSVSKVPEGETGELLTARVKDDWWITNYPKALEIVWGLKWPDVPKPGKKKGMRFVAMLRGDSVRAIVDGEWADEEEQRTEGGSWAMDESEQFLAEAIK